MAEDLALEQLLGERRAVDRHEGPARARAEGVQRARDELLARAALPRDQQRAVVRRDALDALEHVPHRVRAAQDPEVLHLASDRRRRPGDHAALPRAHDRTVQDPRQVLELERLGEEVGGAVLHRGNRRVDAGVARDHDHGQARGVIEDGREHRDALHVGQAQVEHGGVQFRATGDRERGLAARPPGGRDGPASRGRRRGWRGSPRGPRR